MKVTYLSHAALEITTKAKTKFVCDPWILDEPVFNYTTWKFPAPVLDPSDIVNGVDWLLITHSHEDHFHIPSLNKFDRKVKVLLVEYDSHPHLRAHTIERTLRLIGFSDITKISSWEKINLDEEATLTIIPSADSRQHDWENAGFLIEENGVKLLNMNDNVSDDKLCEDINNRWTEIDIAFIQSLGVTMWPGRFKMSEKALNEAVQRKQIAYDEQRRMVDVIRPKNVVPFAGDFCWMARRYEHQNWCNRSTPKLFEDFMRNHASNKNCNVLTMLPSDTWSPSAGWVRNHPELDWENYLESIKKLASLRKGKVDKIDQWLSDSSTDDLKERVRIRLEAIRENIAREYIESEACVKYRVQGKVEFSFYIWLNQSGFDFSFASAPIPHFQTLHLEDFEMAAIIEGKLTWNIIQWVALAEQHFLPENVGKFWYWLEYHIDLNTKNSQVYLDSKILPENVPAIDTERGIFA